MVLTLKCPNCGSEMELVQGNMARCNHCRHFEILKENHDVEIEKIRSNARVRIEKNKTRHKERVPLTKHEVEMIEGFVVLALAIAYLIWSFSYLTRKDPNEIYTPMSSTNCINKTYTDIVDSFSDSGFTTIYTEALGDLVDGWIIKRTNDTNKVTKITINGRDEFDKGASFNKDSPIRIYYHSYPTEP